MLNLSTILGKKQQEPMDDFRIVRTWKEYTDDRKFMKYLMYELEMMGKTAMSFTSIRRSNLPVSSVFPKAPSSPKALWKCTDRFWQLCGSEISNYLPSSPICFIR